jgi:hypothetical protein
MKEEKKNRKSKRKRSDAFPLTLLFLAFRFGRLLFLVVYLCLFGLETSYLKPLRVQRHNTLIEEGKQN